VKEEKYEERSIVGSLINFRGMVYSPINEQGVVLLFGKILKDLNMYVEEIKTGYPDCVARRRTGKGWERIYIEFEYSSSGFKSHLEDYEKGKKCDLVVSWNNNWKECPLPVLELKEEIKNMEPEPFGEEEVKKEESEYDLEHHVRRRNITKAVKTLFLKLDDKILNINEEIYHKYAKTAITYYSPEKTFVYLRFGKSLMVLDVYTKQEKIDGVKNIKFHENWGQLKLKSEKDLLKAIQAITSSYSLIRQAIKDNINTGWYAATPREKLTWLKSSENDDDETEGDK
jgi:predicted transport protein